MEESLEPILDYKGINSIAVIDYDKDFNYRFIVSCADKKLYNFNAQAKKSEDGTCLNQLTSKSRNSIFSSNGKDYLFINMYSTLIF